MKMRFKYSPTKRRLAAMLKAHKKLPPHLGKVVHKPDEIPDSAVRPGTFLVRFGKGDAREFEYISETKQWIDIGKVYYRYGKPMQWWTSPFITPSEFKAMEKIPHMLKDQWQLAYIHEVERRQRRINRLIVFKINKKH